MTRIDNQLINETFAEQLELGESYYAVINTRRLNEFENRSPERLEENLFNCIEVVDSTKEASRICIVSYRCESSQFTNLYNACLRSLTWHFDYVLCDVVSTKLIGKNLSEAILNFNQMYKIFPVVHYYPNPLLDSRRMWIASEVYHSFIQSEKDILSLRISDRSDDDTMFTYAAKIKILLSFFQQQEHNNRLPDEQFGDIDCTCFRETSKYKYEYDDKSDSTCVAKNHFGDFFLSRLSDNIRYLKAGESISDEKYDDNHKMVHMIESILNGGVNDFPGTVPFDIFYILQDLMSEVLPPEEYSRENLELLANETHKCLASKVTATFVLLMVHGLLTQDKTNVLSYFPITSNWMYHIAMGVILGGGELIEPPEHDEGYFPEWHSVMISNTFTGCQFLCHIVKTSNAVLTDSVYILKIIPLGISLRTALNALKNTMYCDCEYGDLSRGVSRGKVIMLDRFESAVAFMWGLQKNT